jgi:hypothetical protein
MTARWPRLPCLLVAVGLIGCAVVVSPQQARADVGIVKVSPGAGVAGDSVQVTVGCGYCFPPCPASPTCMPSRRARQPEHYSFPILMVPGRVSLAPHRCAPINHRTKQRVEGLCPPTSVGLPRRRPFIYLGRALPASSRDDLDQPGAFPLYRLRFRIPAVKPGLYKLAICEGCDRGRRGSLITYPRLRPYRLRVLGPDPATAARGAGPTVVQWVGGTAAGIILLAVALILWRRATVRRAVRARSTSR